MTFQEVGNFGYGTLISQNYLLYSELSKRDI